MPLVRKKDLFFRANTSFLYLASFLYDIELVTGIRFGENSADNFAACLNELHFEGKTLGEITGWDINGGRGFVQAFGALWETLIEATGGWAPEGLYDVGASGMYKGDRILGLDDNGIEVLARLHIPQPPLIEQLFHGSRSPQDDLWVVNGRDVKTADALRILKAVNKPRREFYWRGRRTYTALEMLEHVVNTDSN